MLILECNQKWAWLWKTMSCPLDLEFFLSQFSRDLRSFLFRDRSLEIRRFCQKQLWHHPSFVYSVFATDIVIHCAGWLFHLGVMCVQAHVCVYLGHVPKWAVNSTAAGACLRFLSLSEQKTKPSKFSMIRQQHGMDFLTLLNSSAFAASTIF